MYTYKTIEEHPLNLGFGLKVGYSFWLGQLPDR
jgi:hypothetical protein